MEIYNQNAYDILDQRHIDSPIENWNKDDFGNIHLKHISVHQCTNEQEGIDYLMMGNFVRQVSSTPANQCSSRSHCVFTITIEGKEKDAELSFISQLHLVDLAGSERISQTQVEGSLLNEAKHINLSLTYLEQVILALNQRMKSNTRTHIPYRNSLMTTILQDSLGGNCKTVMIANVSCDLDNYEESISTLRFSQRVGQLENEIRRNEQVDLQAVINRLQSDKLLLIREVEKYQKIIQNGKFLSNEDSKYQDDSENETKSKQKGKKSENFQNPEENINYRDILEKVDLYLNEQSTNLEVQSIEEAQTCFHAMKELYNIRMKEYVTQLTFISEKLQKYDQLLTKYVGQEKENVISEVENSYSNQVNSERESATATHSSASNQNINIVNPNLGINRNNNNPDNSFSRVNRQDPPAFENQSFQDAGEQRNNIKEINNSRQYYPASTILSEKMKEGTNLKTGQSYSNQNSNNNNNKSQIPHNQNYDDKNYRGEFEQN